MSRRSRPLASAPAPPPDHVVRFARDAGPIPWDRGALAGCRLDPEVAHILHVAAVLEEDTAISARQGRALGLDRAADIGAFLDPWEREEDEHGRALRFLLSRQPYDPPPPRPSSIPRRRRGLALVPVTALGRTPMTGVVYGALGAAAEYVAIVIYTELVKRVDEPAVVSLLRSIARQEGRHFAFFLAAAGNRAESLSATQGRLARRALTSIWTPVGVASLGEEGWRDTLAPLLADVDVRARVEKMDRVLDSIPHLGGLRLMEAFLRAHPAAMGDGSTLVAPPDAA